MAVISEASELMKNITGSVNTQTADSGHLSVQLPADFISDMVKMLGRQKAERLTGTLSGRPYRALRLNPLKIKPEMRHQLLDSLPFHMTPVPWESDGYYYEEEDRPGKYPLHDAGAYYIQEPSAMSAAALSGIQPGERVLDLCAAPGGKTSQLAARMMGNGLLVSNEINPSRAKILSQNIERLGIANAVVLNESPQHLAEVFPAFFDRILVDAPCSGEGMFRKEERALVMWSRENVQQCARRQQEILDYAARMLSEGGTLLYSTCTFAAEEDEEQIAAFLMRHPGFELVDLFAEHPEITQYFSHGSPAYCCTSGDFPDEIKQQLTRTVRLFPFELKGEGHFAAMLRRKGNAATIHKVSPGVPDTLACSSPNRNSNKASKTVSDRHYKNKKRGSGGAADAGLSLWENFCKNVFLSDPLNVVFNRSAERKPVRSCDIAASADQDQLRNESESRKTVNGRIIQFGGELYFLPFADQMEQRIRTLKVLRPGIDLGTIRKDRFEPSHALAMAVDPQICRNVVRICAKDPDAIRYQHGESIACQEEMKGWAIVAMDGISAGWGKAQNGQLKNHYPKGLRIQY